MEQRSNFEIYLRTGRRIAPERTSLELKFNPWHDPEDGRFTFAGQGNYFASDRGSGERKLRTGFRGGGGRFGGGGAGGSWGPAARADHASTRASRNRGTQASPSQARFNPNDPRNHSVHVVRRGESLSTIAASRKGLRAADLAQLNGMSPNQPLQVGQPIKLPNQSYLDAGRAAGNKLLALSYYVDTHDGRLPPNAANPPSLEVQIDASGVRTIRSNNYNFDVDVLDRPRRVSGQLQLKREGRSKREQRIAGNPDRLTHDDGGHYIAARFNGPRQRFNHFAQDRNFNRGAYRALEDQWAKALRQGKRVFVDIVPQYEGMSKRPKRLKITWRIDGQEFEKELANEPQSK